MVQSRGESWLIIGTIMDTSWYTQLLGFAQSNGFIRKLGLYSTQRVWSITMFG